MEKRWRKGKCGEMEKVEKWKNGGEREKVETWEKVDKGKRWRNGKVGDMGKGGERKKVEKWKRPKRIIPDVIFTLQPGENNFLLRILLKKLPW